MHVMFCFVGFHRKLGAQISKARSILMDVKVWSSSLIQVSSRYIDTGVASPALVFYVKSCAVIIFILLGVATEPKLGSTLLNV